MVLPSYHAGLPHPECETVQSELSGNLGYGGAWNTLVLRKVVRNLLSSCHSYEKGKWQSLWQQLNCEVNWRD